MLCGNLDYTVINIVISTVQISSPWILLLLGIEEKNAKKLKMDFLNSCKDELKCTICIELFITPVTLNCGHMFCQFCINQFELEVKTNKDFNCPNCKIPITSQTRCRQIENLITAIYRYENIRMLQILIGMNMVLIFSPLNFGWLEVRNFETSATKLNACWNLTN